MKNAMNTFIAKNTNEDTKAVVIDAETLLSSTALVKAGVNPSNIIVLNLDEKVIKKAKARGHVDSVCGITTNVISEVKGSFDIIYLDYCGTPDNSLNGFSPQIDLWWAASNLNENGMVICTFSRRCKNCIEKAKSLIPSTLNMCVDVKYCESSAMYAMVLTKKKRHGLKKMFFKLYNPTLNVNKKRKRKTPERLSYVTFYKPYKKNKC